MIFQLAGDGLKETAKSDTQLIFEEFYGLSAEVTHKVYHTGICNIKINKGDNDAFYEFCTRKDGIFHRAFGYVTVVPVIFRNPSSELAQENEPAAPPSP